MCFKNILATFKLPTLLNKGNYYELIAFIILHTLTQKLAKNQKHYLVILQSIKTILVSVLFNFELSLDTYSDFFSTILVPTPAQFGLVF